MEELYEDIDDTIKRFFMCQIKVNIYRSNVEPLDKSNTIRFCVGQEKKSVYTTVWRRRGRNNEEQVQLSALNLDDSDFVDFRKLIHTADYIVILKLQACLEYDWFIIPKESIAISDDLKALDGKFIHKSTSTVVKIDQNVQMDAVLNNEKTIDLPTSPKSCAEYIINHIYDLDSFQCLKLVFKVNDTTIRVEAEILQNLGLPRKSLRFFFNLPTSASYTKSDNDNKVRVFDKVYDVPTEQGNYHAKLTTEWQDKPLEDDFDGNSLTALIKVVNEYYSHYLKIVQTENGYCLKIKNETTKGIIEFANILFYGVPGCGKSHKVEEEYESKITTEKNKIRVVFHPDYTYSDFVGQVMPVLEKVTKSDGTEEEKLQYKFVPGPFTRILEVAYANHQEKCLLIIEELNRGNAPAIFGEIFQLLDRNDDGSSKYAIYNSDIANEVHKDKLCPIKLPPTSPLSLP